MQVMSLSLKREKAMLKSSNQALLMVMMSRGCESQKIPRIYFDSAEETPEAEKRLAHDDQRLSGFCKQAE